MDSNKFYCRNIMPVASSASSVNLNGFGNTTAQDFASCNSDHVATGLNCKEPLFRSYHESRKSSHNNKRDNNCSAAYGNANNNSDVISTASARNVASTINNGSQCNSFGNYINITSVPTGTIQYHRRKIIPQDYQSRLYHKAADYRCHDEFYSDKNVTTVSAKGNSSVDSQINADAPPRSIQLQGQMQQLHNHHLHSHHHHQTSHQPSQHHYNEQQQTQSVGGIQQLQHSNTCTSTADCAGNTISCNLALGNGQMATATQTHHNSNLDIAVVPTSLTINSLQSQMPPVFYTVHRVVTTAQIQTAGGNTFTSSSSVSSVVSAVRNEIDSMANIATPVSTSPNDTCFVTDISSCHANTVAEGNFSNMPTGQSLLHNSTGNSTNANNYMTIQSKEVGAVDACRTVNATIGNAPQLTDSTYSKDVKIISSISRPLQYVIPSCVYLMSRVAVHMEIEGTAQCPSQVMLAAALGCEELGIANKLLAQSIFGLWMTSALLEIQLKSYHRPYAIQVDWHNLLQKFSHRNLVEKKYDEPMIVLKRNVFFSKRDEEKIK